MAILSGKKVLLAVTAGIAAYKTPFLVRLLIKAGAEVKVLMTPAAKDFVTPLTLSTLSKNEVYSSFTSETDENAVWNNHVELALWADLLLVAPATANTLSKMANGICDNLVLATYLSAKCPVYFAPAMDLDMYKHESGKRNLKTLEAYGNKMIPAAFGELASGLTGEGRMAEPEEIVAFLEQDLLAQLPLRGKKILITAGPTYEAIDPVRFIGNHSSGKMGFALAETAAGLGAEVLLVHGPTQVQLPATSTVETIPVTTAEEMYTACHDHFKAMDIAILAAAVSDYRPKNTATEKIKKQDAALSIALEPTKDILSSLGAIKGACFLAGFALETENERDNAKKKLQKKNLDLIVLNSLRDAGAGFQKDTNKVTLIDKHGNETTGTTKPKAEVARDILEEIIRQIHE